MHGSVQAKLTSMLAGSKATSEKMQKEFAQLNDRVSKLQADLEEQIHQNTELLAENGQKQLLIKSKDEEIAGVKAETAQVTKLRDQTVKKLKALEDAKADTESQRDTLKQGARRRAHVYFVHASTSCTLNRCACSVSRVCCWLARAG